MGASASQVEYPGHVVPFYAPKTEILWLATNALPPTLPVLAPDRKTAPIARTAQVLSVFGFNPEQEVRRGDDAEEHFTWLRGMRAFRDPDNGRTLTVFERQGRLYFTDNRGRDLDWRDRGFPGVPTREGACAKATALLDQLQFTRHELATNAEGGLAFSVRDQVTSWGERETRKLREAVSARCVDLGRMVLGTEVRGGGISMRFEGEGVLSSLRIEWPPLTTVSRRPVVGPAQVIRWIREGRGGVADLETTGARFVEAKEIRRLRILEITAFYSLPLYIENLPARIHPIGIVTAEAEFGPGDVELIVVCCPLIREGLPRARKPARSDFMIFPSRFMLHNTTPEVTP